ncbi:MAG: hypothetical protein ACKPJJ_26430, partial [Planctomycetaceae bacterium]
MTEAAGSVAAAIGVSIRPIVTEDVLSSLLGEACRKHSLRQFSPNFLLAEWRDIIDDMQVRSWDRYRAVQRSGRRVRLSEPQRKQIWQVMETVLAGLAERDLTTRSALCEQVTSVLPSHSAQRFDHVVVDEAQDVGFS